MRDSSNSSPFMSPDAMLIRVTYGAFRERLGIAVQRDGRWMCRFATGTIFEDVDPSKFECICRIDVLQELLGNLDSAA